MAVQTWCDRIFKLFSALALVCHGLLATNTAIAQLATPTKGSTAERSVSEWLVRLHDASRNRAYTGTFVVSVGSQMSSARIWHVCDGSQQLERVDTLSGPARTTVRRNDEVMTFVPESRLTVVERRSSLGLFPALLQTPSHALADFYVLRQGTGAERVAGLETDVIEFQPKDEWRFGYRVWSEKKTGLVLKLQTLDAQQRVLEQVAFSELNLDAPVRVDQLSKLMKNRPGYTVQQVVVAQSTPEAQGWRLKQPVPGYTTTALHVRVDDKVTSGAQKPVAPIQWVFSDGLASVSLFVEPFDAARHGAELRVATGATHSYSRRVDAFWVTAVGEAPFAALRQFTQEIERVR